MTLACKPITTSFILMRVLIHRRYSREERGPGHRKTRSIINADVHERQARFRQCGRWTPPAGTWEDQVQSVRVYRDETTGDLTALLDWTNGHKTHHSTDVVYSRCPQKVSTVVLCSDYKHLTSSLRCCDTTRLVYYL